WHRAYRFNDAQYFWKDVIRKRMPFVKVELMRLNMMGVGQDAVLKRLRTATDYPVEVIERHLDRTRRYYDSPSSDYFARVPFLARRLYWSCHRFTKRLYWSSHKLVRGLAHELRERRTRARRATAPDRTTRPPRR